MARIPRTSVTNPSETTASRRARRWLGVLCLVVLWPTLAAADRLLDDATVDTAGTETFFVKNNGSAESALELEVQFASNDSGGVVGGLTTGQPVVARIAVKPTPTIAKPQQTIDKVSLEDATLAAVTRRDPTIVARVWPVAEAFTAIVLADQLIMHLGYRAVAGMDS